MNDFREVTEKIKDILRDGKKGKIFDKNVAHAIGMTADAFATVKKRESIPYEKILTFCAKNNILINDIFFNQKILVSNIKENS